MTKIRTLIVDDEPGFTKIVKLALEARQTYEVCEVNNPVEALQVAREFSPDVILLDIVMPELDGGDVLAQFKADPVLKDIPVIFVTATVRKREVNKHAGVIGGAFFIAKPVSAEGLIQCIEEHVRD